MIEQIERLTKLPGYESANKVINEALFYGMPILYEKLTGGMVTEEEKKIWLRREKRKYRRRVLRRFDKASK